MAFRGSFSYTLDAKNRLTIPARFRASFADGVVLALEREPARCISIWQISVFDAFTESLVKGFHSLSGEGATVRRLYNSLTHDTELDAAGRVIVPPHMLADTGINGREVVVNGAGDRLELWEQEAWAEECRRLMAAVKTITEGLGDPA